MQSQIWVVLGKQNSCKLLMALRDEMLCTMRQPGGFVHISSLADTAGTLRQTLNAYNLAFPLVWEMLDTSCQQRQLYGTNALKPQWLCVVST